MTINFKPFQGLRVLELSSVLAGPLAGSFFAEGGAEVTKVEHPQWGDITRSWRANGEAIEGGISAYYASANTYKTVHRVDLKSGTKPITIFLPGPFGLRKGPRSEYGIDFKTKIK